jgi:hypothetical protein
MATHIKFRLKNFSKSGEVIKFVKTPRGMIAVSTLGVTSANLVTNASRHKNDRAYQDKQIEAMDKLTRSIKGLDNTVKKSEADKSKPKLINFRPKL